MDEAGVVLWGSARVSEAAKTAITTIAKAETSVPVGAVAKIMMVQRLSFAVGPFEHRACDTAMPP